MTNADERRVWWERGNEVFKVGAEIDESLKTVVRPERRPVPNLSPFLVVFKSDRSAGLMGEVQIAKGVAQER